METLLVTGSKGQLGSELVRLFSRSRRVVSMGRGEADITKLESTRRFIKKHEPGCVIHAAAFTNVDACESEQEKAFRVNALGTRNVAIAAREVEAKLFYISTDYVFDGRKETPYREYDNTNPINVYGASKLLGEKFVAEQMHRFFIIRIAWLYGYEGKNFVKTVLKLAQEKEELQVVDDQRGSPTFTLDVARQIERLSSTDLYGIYHCTSQGECTWYDFASEIVRLAGLKIKVARTTSEKFPPPAKRPRNSVLENYMLKLQGLDIMPPWKESLREFMKNRNNR
jgi:dTDP-4-dehydrorhamnose reductase